MATDVTTGRPAALEAAAGGATERISSIDEAWLHMEEPTNPMMVTGFFTMSRPLVLDEVKSVLADRLLRYERFRQRVVDSRGLFRATRWQFVTDFAIDDHVHVDSLPSPGDDEVLRRALDVIVSEQLDFERPLWDVHLLEGYGDGTAVVFRVHHCIGDGMALMHVLLSLCDPAEPREDGGLVAAPLVRKSLGGSLLRRVGRAVTFVPRFSGSLVHLLFRSKDPHSAFTGELTTEKRTAWSQPVELQRVKELAKRLGCKINDVLLAATAGALRRYLVDRGQPPDGFEITAIVPVNLRPLSEAGRLGNRFGLVIPRLPISIADPIERVRRMQKRMNQLKRSTQAVAVYSFLKVMGFMGKRIQSFFVKFLTGKATGVMTNVPGPRDALAFAGERIERIMFWVPQSGRLGLGVSVLSYAGTVSLGVITDQNLVPDPVPISDAIHDEIALLEQSAA